MSLCIPSNLIDFRNYPFSGPWSYTKTESFQRNNCTGGQTGTYVNYSKVYISDVSPEHLAFVVEEDANEFSLEGQANANSNGTCVVTCTAKTTTVMRGNLLAMDAFNVYISGDPVYENNTFDSQSGFYSVSRSTISSGSGAIPSATFIHNLSPRPLYPQGGTSVGYRIGQNGSNVNLYSGLGSNKCIETLVHSNIMSGPGAFTTAITFDYKYYYGGINNPMNGLYYLTLRYSSVLELYFVPDGGSPVLIGTCHAHSGYGYYSPKDGQTRGFISISNDGTIRVIAYCRQHHAGLTSFRTNITRTMTWYVSKDIYGVPVSLTLDTNEYNNDRLRLDAVCAWGPNNVAVFYRLLRGSDKQGILSFPNSLPSTGVPGVDIITSAVGDSTHIYLQVAGSNGYIRVYNISTGVWSNGRINLY